MKTPALDQLTAPDPEGVDEMDIANHTLNYRPQAAVELAALMQSHDNLLAACEHAEHYLTLLSRRGADPLANELRVAIAKAKGGE